MFQHWHVITPDTILDRGLEISYPHHDEKKRYRVRRSTQLERFASYYGSRNIEAYCQTYLDLQVTDIDEARMEPMDDPDKNLTRFMWAINFLSNYQTSNKIVGDFGVCVTTGKTWIWIFIEKIHGLYAAKILWREVWNPTMDPNLPQVVFIISYDGVHFAIEERQTEKYSKDKSFYSHKFKTAGLTYEIACNLHEDEIVWSNGPFPAGTSDETIFKMEGGLEEQIPDGKLGIADHGYRRCKKTSCSRSLDSEEVQEFKARAKARQESLHIRLKRYDILKQVFRHSIEKHEIAFGACLVLVQYQLENGSPLFDT